MDGINVYLYQLPKWKKYHSNGLIKLAMPEAEHVNYYIIKIITKKQILVQEKPF